MNRISAIALFAAATFAAVHSASAQTSLTVTKVPFAFSVNGTTLPAGTYTVRSTPSSHLMQIRSEGTERPIMVFISAEDNAGQNLGRGTELVFKAYGSQYFLHEIVSLPSSTDVIVPASKLEKKARVEWASKSGSEPVQIALK